MPNEEAARLASELAEMIRRALELADTADIPLVAIHLDEALATLKRVTGC